MQDNVKLLALDLDGTLLHTDKSISDYSVSVLNRCRQAGILTAVVTARSETAARRYIDRIDPDIVVSCGGALARYKCSTVYRSVMPADLSDSLITDLISSEGVGDITVETDDGYFVSYTCYADSPDYAHGIYRDFSKPLCRETYKITVEIFDDVLADRISGKYTECGLVRFYGESWCRIASKDATKMKAIEAAAKALDIPTWKIAAFGDDYIDAGILEACGTGVAMGNTVAALKAVSDYTCDTNDNDGVAKWIEEYVLG